MNPTVIVLMGGLGAQALAVVGLALRLWHQAKRDSRRQEILGHVAVRVPPAGTLELHDIRDDGSQLCLRIATSRNDDV